MTQATTAAPKKGERHLGDICWNELHTRDAARAKDFYTKVIGWSIHQCEPAGSGVEYMEWVRADGAHVGAMMKMPPGVPAQVPSNWAIYVNVDDVDATAAKATKLGGKVIVPPFDIPNVGRMSTIADPSGAVFNAFKGVGDCGARVPQDSPGSFCWTELMTHDPAACKSFYSQLLGWSTSAMPMGPGFEYTLWWRPGADQAKKQGGVGGMMKIAPEMGPMPSCWLTYIAVANVDATAAKVTANGGTVAVPPQDIPNVGRFAVCMDPTGATFAIFTHK